MKKLIIILCGLAIAGTAFAGLPGRSYRVYFSSHGRHHVTIVQAVTPRDARDYVRHMFSGAVVTNVVPARQLLIYPEGQSCISEILQNEIPLKGELRHSWRENLLAYQKEVQAFHTIPDYHAALKFFILGHPKLREILTDWNKN